MAGDLRYEDPQMTFFITSRTIASRLWFVNNHKLHQKVAAFLAKYQEKYGVILHAFIIMGNHYHLVARFPNANKTDFLRSFDSMFARLVGVLVPQFHGGKVWARPARCQELPEPGDIENWVLYAALNPVSSGLTQKYTEYDTFNSFSNAVSGKVQKFELVNWTAFRNAQRVNKNVRPKDYTTTHSLTFSRIPGYEGLSRKDYMLTMEKKAEEKRTKIIQERLVEGEGFAGVDAVRSTEPGANPLRSKKSRRDSKRPLILTLSFDTKKIQLDRYLCRLEDYRLASQRFRNGALDTPFPPGTYRPPLFVPL